MPFDGAGERVELSGVEVSPTTAVPVEREGVPREGVAKELSLLAELPLRVGPTQVASRPRPG